MTRGMETDEFLKTPYAQELIANVERSVRDLEEFNKTWQGFWQKNLNDLGRILVSHLSIEHYLNEWLSAANPGATAFGETRLSFAQKLSLVNSTQGLFQWIRPGIARLNRIRNDIAHDMSKTISYEDLQPIKNIVLPWHKAAGKPCREGVDLIQDFALMVCGMLASDAKAITLYGEGAGLVAYRRWLQEAMKTPDSV